jgi:hypothetical protein
VLYHTRRLDPLWQHLVGFGFKRREVLILNKEKPKEIDVGVGGKFMKVFLP